MTQEIGLHLGRFILGLLNFSSHINTISTICTGNKWTKMSEGEIAEIRKTNIHWYDIISLLEIKRTTNSGESIWDYNKILHDLYVKLLDISIRIDKKIDQVEIADKICKSFYKSNYDDLSIRKT